MYLIHEEFCKVAKQFKNKIAAVCKDKKISYKELNALSNQLARVIRAKGITNGNVVAISTDKSIEFLIAFFAVLKSGACLLYIDPNAPQKRKSYILKDSKAKIVLTKLDMKDNCSSRIESFYIDELSLLKRFDDSDILNSSSLEDAAYIIYTSGSTGNPKGVVIPHVGIANHASHYISKFNLSDQDIYAQFASYLFDASISEIVIALLSGGTLHIITNDIISNYRKFENYLNSSKTTVITLPPTYLTHLIPENVQYLRLLITVGSPTNHILVKKWINKVKYINAYGPSEISIAATTYICNDDPFFYEYNSVPIGNPISNYQLYIRKEDNIIEHIDNIKYGVKGELCIGGIGLAKEYINLPNLTKEKFISLDTVKGTKRIYCTGDVVVLNTRGYLEFIGRIDTQVKIRGYRIELEEINKTILNNFREIKDCYTTVIKNSEESGSICTYLICNSKFLENIFRTRLSQFLPSYMTPTYLVCVNEFQLNSSGKVDLTKLPSPFDKINNKNINAIAKKDKIESTVYNIWCKTLKIKNCNLNESFFHLGGDSLKAIKIATYLSEELNIDFTVNNLFKNDTNVRFNLNYYKFLPAHKVVQQFFFKSIHITL
ncbi:non-ribosomal peptide synthetase [Rickettsia argasii]|uniref:Gramicidin S synthase 1 n=1 Tax=Rickettsia argasii T170-B TaxID=1268837 RepID=A0A0F3RDB9_9RICK|nr:non-ribosomal peptide synthetase [Rickettsia argasii]KJW04268.1 gramicidin S synthase 1 [Rickettsia argasii T170-B]